MNIREYLESKETEFPEGKIITLDNRVLECYPIANENVNVVDDQMKLDTTGRYLTIGNKKPKPEPPTPKDIEEQRELFINNAFYLLAHKERIMSDSRMFLCPVAVQSGIAYTGTSGFKRPTLGIYLEWWALAPNAMQTDKKGRKLLVYQIAGSPLSGANHCGAIRDDGKREIVTLLSFGSHWGPFTHINHRYNEAKYMYQAYTLQDVLDILHKEDKGDTDYAHGIEIQYLKHEIEQLKQEVERMAGQCDEWQAKYEKIITKYHGKRMLDYYALYEEALANANTETESLREQKNTLKADLKSGKLDNITYQRQLTPLNKRIKDIEYEVSRYRYGKVREAFANEDEVTFNIIEKFVLANRKQEDGE